MKRNSIKLENECKILEQVVISLASIYNDENSLPEQKSLLETIIGAAIWYLPIDKKLYSGKISMRALEAVKNGLPISSLTKEHTFPRKLAGKSLLQSEYAAFKNGTKKLIDLYKTKYGIYNYVLKKENKELVSFQKETHFIDPADAYSKAKIELGEVSYGELMSFSKKQYRLNCD
jgi:hypothetical protein